MLYFHKHIEAETNGRHFADDIFKCISWNENVWIPIRISLKFVPKGPINNIPAMVQIMAWRRPGDKPLSEAMMVSLLAHICVTRPQWVKLRPRSFYILMSLLPYTLWNVQHSLLKNQCRRYSSDKIIHLKGLPMKNECFYDCWPTLQLWFCAAEIRQLVFRFDILVPHEFK